MSLSFFSKAKKVERQTQALKIIKETESENLSAKQLKLIRWANDTPRVKVGKIQDANLPGSIIDFKNVSKYYLFGSVVTKVFADISFSIAEGDFAILNGKSGSGKSTILNLMSGLDRATEGDIIVDSVNLAYLKNSELTKFRRQKVSFIFQSYNLLGNINGYDNVQVGAYLQGDKTKLLDIQDLFTEFELDDIKFKFPSQMSGGQQQRISILRALVKNAKIIFADEPTGALDENNTNIVLRILKYINKKYKTTIVMVSHDPQMEPLADLIIKINNGKLTTKRQKSLSFEEFLQAKNKTA
ncbi:ABC transporter ATP-binding protein [Mesomycoplasma ovipneumoniae]|uniref:ABC transporter ATP-binding protein n=1 Tax=Mesomycoplasma ovipneumoniae 14811 TaxID=1188239 RepID=A0A014M3B9_9BACT|nr:ABC transporter ATP-binding protein [Mesomycoplasma ovipneumoniae]EXU61453.1 ABC transporter ATP-binding protein [Mesomycoplasma ovipneumoniae 14811]MCN0157969.1 ABC transporter ATP-binding protein [Mesomycoplasma ovipneumoniae]MDW2923606.1 ABC transporter ATP-binding protein [Mesomycoplasma ovipneumoniae]MDW2933732.1 ABC transporter ATP-binding protein [Mesomycoplasma ovipneumoniae]WNM15494.1 ABC transporter ATP-binding protein [Mesomycoplasma ovipneumoniae]